MKSPDDAPARGGASLPTGKREFRYIVDMLSKTIETRARTTKAGTNLSIDADVADADVAVVVTATPESSVESPVDANEWPEGFLDRVAGSMLELCRGPQGDFEARLPL